MSNKPKNTVVLLLSFLQIVLSFVLGVFGNKLSEIVKIRAGILFACVIITIGLLLTVTVLLLNYQIDGTSSFPQYGLLTISRSAASRVVTAFPFAFIVGGLAQLFSILLLTRNILSADPLMWTFHSYEFLAGAIAIFTIILFKGLNRDLALMVSYCLGLGTGVSAAILLLRPFENAPVLTFTSWNIFLITVGFIARSGKIRTFFKRVLDNLMNDNGT